MHTLLIYDIVDDKIRNCVAEICKDYSLIRVQKSAFLGDISRNRQQELYLKIRRTLGNAAGNVQIYTICSKDINLRKEINNGGLS